MNNCPELCGMCRYFGLYDISRGQYYCTGMRMYFTDFRKECEKFAPTEEAAERPVPAP